ncbi:MAG: thiamine diphosphokinase [Aestuariivirgaceae bacterium]
MSRFTILLNGPVMVTDRLKQQTAGTRSIAADGGMAHAVPLGLDVELWIGDFDSTSEALAARHRDIPCERFSAAKDKTDGELAADAAIARGATSMLFVGGFGGQSDHALGHFALALRLARTGVAAMLSSGEEEAYPVLPGSMRPALPLGSRLSIIALADLSGLTLRGTHWPLHGAEIPLGSTSTLSNIVTGPVEIELVSGYGVLIAYPQASEAA